MLYEDYNVDPSLNTAPPPIGAPEVTTKIKNTNEIDRRMMAAIAEIGKWVDDRFDLLGSMANQNASMVSILGGGISSTTINGSCDIDAVALKRGTIDPARLPASSADAAKFNGMTPQQWYDQIYPLGAVHLTLLDRGSFPARPSGVTASWSFVSSARYLKLSPKADYTGTPNNPQLFGNTNTFETSADGGHDHGGRTANKTLTIATMPKHSHTVAGGGLITNGGIGYKDLATNQNSAAQTTSEVGGGEPHNHDISAESDHRHTVAVQPTGLVVQMWVRVA